MVDIHTHILPGVDDGAKTLEESVEMCRMAVLDGIDTIIATPHAYWSRDINGETVIVAGVSAVQESLRAHKIDLVVVGGCEVPMQRNLVDKLKLNRHWTIAGAGRYLLLEPPWGPLPDYCFSLTEELIDRGMTPIIAHPERSPDLQKTPRLLASMIAMGCLSQITANSLLGHHGKAARNVSWKLIEQGEAHIVASDSHNVTNRSPILSLARAAVEEAYGAAVSSSLFEENPRRVAEGRPVNATRPEPAQPAKESGLSGLLRRLVGH